MYSIPTVVHLCCTQAWWGPGEADSSSTLVENLKKKNLKKKMLLSKEDPKQETAVPVRPAVFPLGRFASLKQHCCTLRKELLWNSLYPTVQYIPAVEVSVVVSF